MRLNAFGEPRPSTLEELGEALDMVGLSPEDAQAIIRDCRDEEEPFKGFCAEISSSETGEGGFETCGFPEKEDLIEGLESLGIFLIVDEA